MTYVECAAIRQSILHLLCLQSLILLWVDGQVAGPLWGGRDTPSEGHDLDTHPQGLKSLLGPATLHSLSR